MDTAYTACSITENEITPKKRFSPKRILFDYFGYILICLLTFGGGFCYDNSGALQDKFQSDMNMPTSKFVMLYTVYSWPNVVLGVFGGFLLDSVFGVTWGTMIYLSLTLIGQLLFAMGTFTDIFWLMVLGRFVFGIGCESVSIAQNSYTFIWFGGESLNLLFGLQTSFALLGSISNTLTIRNIYNFVSENLNYSGYECLGIVLFLAAIACLGSIVCALLLNCIHKSSDKVLKTDNDKPPEIAKLSDIKDFKLTYWLIVLLCSAYYTALFTSLTTVYFMSKYHFESSAANKAVSLIDIISAVSAPLFGIVIDKVGKNVIWVIMSIIGSLLAHGLLAFTYASPYICMAVLGISSSLFSTSIWPMIAHVMPEHQLGTAYGINQSAYNLSAAVTTIICGIIVDNYGYFVLELFFITWLLIALVPAVMIWILDLKSTDKPYDAVKTSDAKKDLILGDLVHSSVICANETSFLTSKS